MSSLLESRWAPSSSKLDRQPRSSSTSQSSTTAIPNNNTPATPSQELARFMKIVARLKWKLPFLAEGYRLATNTTNPHDPDIAHAQIMFKIDFHEYYALLERAIVHLLGVFGIPISSSFSRSHLARLQSLRPADPRYNYPLATHRYHANVLEALEDPTNPLYSVLGRGSVYDQLKKAKELRNRWKTADMSREESGEGGGPVRRREVVVPLESYDFDRILAEIFGGLEDAYLLAREHAERWDRGVAKWGSGMGAVDESADWDFIVDAMDWEAV